MVVFGYEIKQDDLQQQEQQYSQVPFIPV